MKEEIQTFDEIIEDIESIKADLDWAIHSGNKELCWYFEICLKEKRLKLKEYELKSVVPSNEC